MIKVVPVKLDKDQIVAVALELLNEVGLDALTTRVLATRLGVKQPALYWHFKDRRALLDEMNEVIEAQFRAAMPATDLPWQDYVYQMGQSFRAALMSHRDGARVHAGSRANRGQFEQQMSVLIRGGLPMLLAVQLMVSVGRFIVGWVLEEQASHTSPSDPYQLPDGLAGQAIRLFFETGDKAAFDAGLLMIIKGAEAIAGRG